MSNSTALQTRLLNWDHEVTPTPMADLIENIRCVFSDYTGYAKSCITIVNNVLTIEALRVENNEEYPVTCLVLNCAPFIPNEIYGRSHNCGLGSMEVADIVMGYGTEPSSDKPIQLFI